MTDAEDVPARAVTVRGPFVLADVWLRDGDSDGGWRVWKRHSTPLNAGDMPAGLRG